MGGVCGYRRGCFSRRNVGDRADVAYVELAPMRSWRNWIETAFLIAGAIVVFTIAALML
jgi:hypothetical protein